MFRHFALSYLIIGLSFFVMAFSLPKLPYSNEDLAPAISKETIGYHYNKHHQSYLDNLNKIISLDLSGHSLEEVIIKSCQNSEMSAIFNNAAQVWNHSFYWESMKPHGGGLPHGKLLESIVSQFGSFDNFKDQFKASCLSQFGSGWCWLVTEKNGTLKIVKTSNAANPITDGLKPIFTIDVWEHAYYLDHQNRRGDYIDVFFNSLVNWQFAEKNLTGVGYKFNG